MGGDQATGRFWLCPNCRKHVPVRDSSCVCGFDRSAVPTQIWEVSSRPGAAPRGSARSAFRELWPFAVIAFLIGWIALDRPRRATTANTARPSAAETASSAATAPHIDAVTRAEPLAPAAPAPRHDSWRPPSVPPPRSGDSSTRTDPGRPLEEPTPDPRLAYEAQWRLAAIEHKAQLVQLLDAYKAALCTEARGGVPVGPAPMRHHLDIRSEYVSARSAAEAFVEAARVAGINTRLLELNMSDYPQPAPAQDLANRDLGAWGCR